MTILNATEARSKLYTLIDETTETHQPIVITGKRGNAVLVSEEDWNSIAETLHLLSVPGMRESKHIDIGVKEKDSGSFRSYKTRPISKPTAL
ncbi:MAG: type II toxin-antitoxin system Phd/YefM family antitoxin [Gammaproteobacteria bacterium]